MKVKKAILSIVLIFCVALSLITLSGCGYKGYSGDNPDLFTVAINSLLWNKGHSDTADRYCDSKIEVLESDEYGRTLYTYFEDYYDKITFSSLIISQHSYDGYVYYYEDSNYLIKKQINWWELEDFSQEEIEKLKQANDWDKELDLSKCVKKQITRKKREVPTSTETLESKVKEHFHVNENIFWIEYLSSDVNEKFIFYGTIRKSSVEDSVYFVALANKDGEILDWLVPQNLFVYQEELRNFKQKNDWVSES